MLHGRLSMPKKNSHPLFRETSATRYFAPVKRNVRTSVADSLETRSILQRERVIVVNQNFPSVHQINFPSMVVYVDPIGIDRSKPIVYIYIYINRM